MEHTWKITKLFANRDYPIKTVSKVELKCTSSDQEETVENIYVVDIPLVEGSFIPFVNLTEEIVISWCGDLSTFETQNAVALTEKLAGPLEYAVPW